MSDLLRGQLVRLTAEEPETRAKAEARWAQNSEFHRLADSEPAQMWSEKKHKEWIEKRMEKGPDESYFYFSIRTLDEDRLIGFTMLRTIWAYADGWVGIGIGERDCWDKGYGTDAMRLMLHFAFAEVNLQRVSLALHEYNARALRSYEKAGFRLEGRMRKDQMREGKRTDTLFMGILRGEWERPRGAA